MILLRGRGNGRPGENHLVRTCCLKYATQIVSDLEMEPEYKINLALETAQKFEKYIKENDRQPQSEGQSIESDSIPF